MRDPAPSPRAKDTTPWREGRYCVVDLELTGLDPRRDEILSFGAVTVERGRAQVGGALEGRRRPTRGVPGSSAVVHGLRTVDLADAPSGPEALAPLAEALAGRVLVAHDLRVEVPFLRAAWPRGPLRWRGPALDTLVLVRLLAREEGWRAPEGLGEVARALGLEAHQAHDALGDALTTAEVFLCVATRLDRRHPESLGSLLRAPTRLSLAPPGV